MNGPCTCAACGKQGAFKYVNRRLTNGLERQEELFPPGWGREFCRRDPDNPKKNRFLCVDCLKTEKVQSGTVRYIEDFYKE